MKTKKRGKLKKPLIYLLIIVAIVVATALSFTGFVVQQYSADCVDKEMEITMTKDDIKTIEVSMLNTGKRWKPHEVGLAFKNYGIDISGGQTETTEIIYKGEEAPLYFDVIPTYYGTDDQELTIEYQMQRLKGLATKTQKTRRFGETCYIYVKIRQQT